MMVKKGIVYSWLIVYKWPEETNPAEELGNGWSHWSCPFLNLEMGLSAGKETSSHPVACSVSVEQVRFRALMVLLQKFAHLELMCKILG